jgi:hypothetical protein
MKEGQSFGDWLKEYHAIRDTASMIRYAKETPHSSADVDEAARKLAECRSRVAEKIERARRETPQYEAWLEKYLSHFPKIVEKAKKGLITPLEAREEIKKAKASFKRELEESRLKEEIEENEDPLSRSLATYTPPIKGKNVDSDEDPFQHWNRRAIATIEDSDYDTLTENLVRRPEFDGREAQIFEDVDGNFIKIVETGENLRDFLIDKVYTHNILFPETEYKILGLVRDPYTKAPSVVLKQEFIKGELLNEETMEEFSNQMRKWGYLGDGYNWTLGPIEVTDTREENVLKGEDGKFYVIDPEISVNPD